MNSAQEEAGAAHAAAHFHLPGPPRIAGPLPGGLIHRSWVVEAGGLRFVLQRLNRKVFPDLDAVMSNMAIVTRHIAGRLGTGPRGEARRRTLTLVASREERDWWEDERGDAWRCTLFVEGSVARYTARHPDDAYEAGVAFGEFSALLSDLATPLAVTIPGFHDTPSRLAALRAAVEADPVARAAGVRDELELVAEHAALAHVLPAMLASGAIPARPAHNDAKIANVLFHEATGRALAVVDLDTVMPGSLLHDIGDLVRSTVGSTAEDDPVPGRMRVRVEYFAALVRGLLAGAGETCSHAERALIVTAGRAITLEQAVRFLTDHVAGDVYYPLDRPGHNLDRARTQLALFADLTARAEELEEIVAGL